MTIPVSYAPIGTYHSTGAFKSSSQVQSAMDETRVGEIRFADDFNFDGAFDGYTIGDRIWVLYCFHEAQGWRPKVKPPRFSDTKVGVFATRSPYRPNPIGMSCLILGEHSSVKMTVEGGDLIDGTPILDIKPYLSNADAHADESPAWYQEVDPFLIQYDRTAAEQVAFLEENDVRIDAACLRNLSYPPLIDSRKRIRQEGEGYRFAYRTWRVQFQFDESETISIWGISSGYSDAEMNDPADPHTDKELHRAFMKRFV